MNIKVSINYAYTHHSTLNKQTKLRKQRKTRSINPQFLAWLNAWDDHEFAARAVLLHHLGCKAHSDHQITRSPDHQITRSSNYNGP